jgi:hypothetical protein
MRPLANFLEPEFIIFWCRKLYYIRVINVIRIG